MAVSTAGAAPWKPQLVRHPTCDWFLRVALMEILSLHPTLWSMDVSHFPPKLGQNLGISESARVFPLDPWILHFLGRFPKRQGIAFAYYGGTKQVEILNMLRSKGANVVFYGCLECSMKFRGKSSVVCSSSTVPGDSL